MKNPIHDIPHYLSIYQKYIGLRMYAFFLFILLAGLMEGVGILMFLPLLQAANNNSQEVVAISTDTNISFIINNFISSIGLEVSTIVILVVMAAIFLIKGVLVFISYALNVYFSSKLMQDLKVNLVNRYIRMNLSYYFKRDTGYFTSLVNDQVGRAVQSFRLLANVGVDIINSIVYLSLAFIVSWRFGLMALVVGIILLTLFRRLSYYVRIQSRKTTKEDAKVAGKLIQMLQAFKYLKATNQLHVMASEIFQSIYKLKEYQVRSGMATAFTSSSREPIVVAFMLIIVTLQLLIFEEKLAPILISILLFYKSLSAIMSFQSNWQSVLEYIGSMEVVNRELDNLSREYEVTGGVCLSQFKDEICFKNVSFFHDKRSGNIIEDVSFVIPVRKTIAFVGESGSGKTTVINLIELLLQPQKGEILINGISSKKIDTSTWRNQIGYVSQESVVFNDTILNNISMKGAGINTQESVKIAALKAHLSKFIDTLPDGYDTVVGENGFRLSGGQRQRLFIAREIFREPNILILDEATSSLDTESERAIQRSIDELKGKVTIIIIAHRLSTIRNADLIYVLDKGRLIEQGEYDELRNNKKSKFSRLVAAQVV
jgi:ABC-type multidrug transport system fused ATPase/permease subunit